jgi:hypothetical protein
VTVRATRRRLAERALRYQTPTFTPANGAPESDIPETALTCPPSWYDAPLCEVCTFPEGWCECVSAKLAAGSR